MIPYLKATLAVLEFVNKNVLVTPPGKRFKNNVRPDGTLVDPGPGPISIRPAVNKPGLYCHEQPIPRPFRGRNDKTWG